MKLKLRAPIPNLVLVSLAVMLAAGCNPPPEETGEAEPTVAVEVAQVRRMDVDIRVGGPATIYAHEQANVASRLTSRILELGARKGDTVGAGRVLARLEDNDLRAQRTEAAAAVADAEASLARVSAGTVPAELERARGDLAAAQAALDQARADYERRSGLFEQGAIPERDLLASRTEMAKAQANADVAATALRLLENQTGANDIAIAESQLEQARSRLDLIDAQLGFATIRSPFAGTITEQYLYAGDIATPDRPVFTLADLSVAVARTRVPEADATGLNAGQSCVFDPADRSSTTWSGKVTVVNAAVDPGTRTVEVWCEIANPDGRLRAGAFGKVSITTATLPDAVVAPSPAIQFDQGLPVGIAMVVGPDGRAERREVTTGPSRDEWISIESGLEPGESVIVVGGYGLPDGTRVTWSGDPE